MRRTGKKRTDNPLDIGGWMLPTERLHRAFAVPVGFFSRPTREISFVFEKRNL
jgi:hypothetical protein